MEAQGGRARGGREGGQGGKAQGPVGPIIPSFCLIFAASLVFLLLYLFFNRCISFFSCCICFCSPWVPEPKGPGTQGPWRKKAQAGQKS